MHRPSDSGSCRAKDFVLSANCIEPVAVELVVVVVVLVLVLVLVLVEDAINRIPVFFGRVNAV